MLQDLKPAAPRGGRFLAYGRQHIDDADIEAVVRVLKSDYLTTGPAVPAFEQAFAEAVDAPHAVSCANGTAALHLAARALDLGPGDTAIVPSITFVATANAVALTGADVVFADVDPETGLMGIPELEAAIARLPAKGKRALFHVHLNGRTTDIPGVSRFARKAGLAIVEDCCHALGTDYMAGDGRWGRVGDAVFADLCVFSFHPVKTIAAGEGGAITTRDSTLAERLRRDRSHGLERAPQLMTAPFATDTGGAPAPWAYELVEPGLNYRLSDIQAALAASQLSKLETFVAERRRLAAHYDLRLTGLWPTVRPSGRSQTSIPALHLYAVLIDFARLGLTRTEVVHALKMRGIGTQVHYIPVHRQPYYASRYGIADLPGADAYYSQCLSLPLYVGLTTDDVDRVVAALGELARH